MTFVTKGLLIAVICASAIALAQRAAEAAPSCQFSTATIAFGSYNVYTTSATAITGTISGVCTSGASSTTRPIIKLGTGLHGTFAARKMLCGSGTCSTAGFSTDTLQYNLYTTAAHSTVWGDGTGVTASVQLATSCCGNNVPWSTSIFGLMPAAIAGSINDSAVGVYGDTVVVTMTF
jgi:spore coat protein U-like protein